jgi:uncharacterized membrane protein
MTQATAMLDTYPNEIGIDKHLLAQAIEATVECSQACTACADACLSEPDVVGLIRCIRENLDCADICDATSRVLSRHTGDNVAMTRAMLQACVAACRSCGDECARHAGHHEHCRVCADQCRRCEDACRQLLDSMG